MQKPSVTRARIVLFGLKEHLASQLKQVLTAQDHEVYSQLPAASAESSMDAIGRLGADLVFCSANRDQYLALLHAIGLRRPDLPVVVVSETPEVSEWLDAIEAGASDYCTAPFEPSHIQWILDSTLQQRAPLVFRAAG